MDFDLVFRDLKKTGYVENLYHTGGTLRDHLEGTYSLLKKWGASESVCLSGLCHSLYGTESYRKASIDISMREQVSNIIGKKSEKLVYCFGVHVKDHFWDFLEGVPPRIKDRFTGEVISLNNEMLFDFVNLTMANWLEQRPRVPEEYKQIRKKEFLQCEQYLLKPAWLEFLKEYGVA